MCDPAKFAWLLAHANLFAGFFGIIGSILLVVPTWLGASLREETLRIDELRARLVEPALLDPLVVHALSKSIAFVRREQLWVRAGALCLLASFALMLLDAAWKP